MRAISRTKSYLYAVSQNKRINWTHDLHVIHDPITPIDAPKSFQVNIAEFLQLQVVDGWLMFNQWLNLRPV